MTLSPLQHRILVAFSNGEPISHTSFRDVPEKDMIEAIEALEHKGYIVAIFLESTSEIVGNIAAVVQKLTYRGREYLRIAAETKATGRG